MKTSQHLLLAFVLVVSLGINHSLLADDHSTSLELSATPLMMLRGDIEEGREALENVGHEARSEQRQQTEEASANETSRVSGFNGISEVETTSSILGADQSNLTLEDFRAALKDASDAERFVIVRENGMYSIQPESSTPERAGRNRSDNINIVTTLRKIVPAGVADDLLRYRHSNDLDLSVEPLTAARLREILSLYDASRETTFSYGERDVAEVVTPNVPKSAFSRSAFTTCNAEKAAHYYEVTRRHQEATAPKTERAMTLRRELRMIQEAHLVRTEVAKKEQWIQFIKKITMLGSMLAKSKYAFIEAARLFEDTSLPLSNRVAAMKTYLRELKEKIETADLEHASFTGHDATQTREKMLSLIHHTGKILDDVNYTFVIGSGVAGAAGYAIPAAIHAVFCKSALPLALVCPTAIPFTLAAATLSAMGSYAYLKGTRRAAYTQTLSDMDAATSQIEAIKNRSGVNITVRHTAMLSLWLATELTKFAKTTSHNN